jgi:hypothetical protein
MSWEHRCNTGKTAIRQRFVPAMCRLLIRGQTGAFVLPAQAK